MDQCRCRTRGYVLGQPAREWFHLGYVVRLGAGVALDPGLYLATKKALGIAEFAEPGRVPIDGVNLHQRFHYRVRKALAEFFVRYHPWWECVIQDDTLAPLHHVKRHPQNSQVVAKEIWPRGQWKDRVDPLKQAGLALHVVRLRRHRPERWAAQYPFPVAYLHQVGQVGGAGRELARVQRSGTQPGDMAAQVLFHLGEIELLS